MGLVVYFLNDFLYMNESFWMALIMIVIDRRPHVSMFRFSFLKLCFNF